MSALEPPSGPAPGGVQVFVSYRRKDSAGHAGRLYDTLRARLDSPEIFMDIDAIEAGVDFVDVIHEAVGKCDVLLAVIGPDWLTLKNDAGERRIDESGDFVRIEIEAALSRNVRVIPVLVDGGRMPPISQLPPSLAKFGRRHALEISDARWGFDAGRLVETIEKIAVAKSDEAARVAAAAVAAEAARVAAKAAAAAEAEAAAAEAARLEAETRSAEDARLAADSAAAEEARVAEEARLATAAAATAAAAAAAAERTRQAAEAAAAEEARATETARESTELAATDEAQRAAEATADEEARTAATAAVAIGTVGSNEGVPPVDPDAPTGTWPVSGAVATATKRPPGGQNLPRFAAPIAAVLVIALGLGTIVVGAGVLGGGAAASPSSAVVDPSSLPVPSGVYVAIAGDTLTSIAGKFGVTLVALAAANPGLSPSDVLPVGQIVVVPGSEPDPSSAQASAPSESVAPSPSDPPSAPPPSPTGDTTKPTGSAKLANSADFTRSPTVRVDVSNVSKDAVEMAYSTSDSSPSNWQKVGDFSVVLPKQGKYQVHVRFRDAARNESEPVTTETVTYDATPPSIQTFSVNGTKSVNGKKVVYNDDVVLTLKASDALGSVRYRLSNSAGGLDGTTNPYDSSVPWKLAGTKDRTVYVRFSDSAGNHVDRSFAVYYDRKPTARAWRFKCIGYAGSSYVNLTPFVAGGDSDPDGDPLHITSAGMASGYGNATKTSDTSIRYSYTDGEHPPTWIATVNYTISDNHGGTDSGTFRLDMSPFYTGCTPG